jgi:putative holliday junction resolvase
MKTIAALVREHEATLVVMGLPLSMSGEHGTQAQHAVSFSEALSGFVDVPVVFQDERLSTVEAERGLRAAGIKGPDRRHVIDRSAAAVILQAWLDAQA